MKSLNHLKNLSNSKRVKIGKRKKTGLFTKKNISSPSDLTPVKIYKKTNGKPDFSEKYKFGKTKENIPYIRTTTGNTTTIKYNNNAIKKAIKKRFTEPKTNYNSRQKQNWETKTNNELRKEAKNQINKSLESQKSILLQNSMNAKLYKFLQRTSNKTINVEQLLKNTGIQYRNDTINQLLQKTLVLQSNNNGQYKLEPKSKEYYNSLLSALNKVNKEQQELRENRGLNTSSSTLKIKQSLDSLVKKLSKNNSNS